MQRRQSQARHDGRQHLHADVDVDEDVELIVGDLCADCFQSITHVNEMFALLRQPAGQYITLVTDVIGKHFKLLTRMRGQPAIGQQTGRVDVEMG